MASPWLHARLRTPTKRGAALDTLQGSPHVGASTPLTSPALVPRSGSSTRFPMASFGATPTTGRSAARAPQSAPHNHVVPRATGLQAAGAATMRSERVRSRFALVSDGMGGEVAVDAPGGGRAASVASATTMASTSLSTIATGNAWAQPVQVRRELLPEEAAFAQLFEAHGDTSPTAAPRAADAPDVEAADMASEYGRLVQERVDAVSGVGGADLSMHSVVTTNEQRMLGMERDTWVLLEGLLPELVLAAQGDQPTRAAVRAREWDTDHKLVRELFATHAELRRLRVAVQWLEWVGSDERATTFVESHVGQSTVVALRTAANTGKRDANLVTECDPDAPTRQRKQLHADDAAKMQYLYAGVWRCLRAGQLAEAQQLCRDFDQHWLAASLGGGAWGADAQLDDSDASAEGTITASTGNAARSLWKEACARFARSPDAGQTQRAVFGLLAGDADAALPLCGSWTDAAWVYMRVLLDKALDARLAEARRNGDDDDDGDDAMEDGKSGGAGGESLRAAMRDTVQQLRTHTNDAVRREAAHPFHHIQALLLTGQVNALAQALRTLVTDEATTCAALVQRFAAHALLLLQMAGVLAPESVGACHDAVRAYCTLLTPSHDAHVVALYTAQLPAALQVETFARFLENIDERDERTRCLEYARRRFPEQVDAITRRVVQNVCYVVDEEERAEEGEGMDVGKAPDGDATMGAPAAPAAPAAAAADGLGAGMGLDEALASQPPTPVPPIAVRADPRKLRLDRASSISTRTHTTMNTNVSDAKRIRSIEWLCFDREQRAEAVMESNALVRVLVLQGKEEEARKPFVDVLPADSIEVIHETWAAKYADGAVPHEEELAVREYLMWKAYLECYRAYGEWFATLHARPQRSDSATATAAAAAADSNIAAIRREHEDAVFAQEMMRWERTAREQADAAVARLLEVLHFEGGWMCDSDEDAGDVSSNAARMQQLEDLRRLCIPKVVMLLHHVLHSMGEHKRALAVSTLVADERTALFTLFSKAQLQAFMDLMRQSAVEVSRSELV